jgi:hypothetical protein
VHRGETLPPKNRQRLKNSFVLKAFLLTLDIRTQDKLEGNISYCHIFFDQNAVRKKGNALKENCVTLTFRYPYPGFFKRKMLFEVVSNLIAPSTTVTQPERAGQEAVFRYEIRNFLVFGYSLRVVISFSMRFGAVKTTVYKPYKSEPSSLAMNIVPTDKMTVETTKPIGGGSQILNYERKRLRKIYIVSSLGFLHMGYL